jgi:hypothetical protein
MLFVKIPHPRSRNIGVKYRKVWACRVPVIRTHVLIHEGLATPIRQEGFLYERSIILVLVARKGVEKRERKRRRKRNGAGSVVLFHF